MINSLIEINYLVINFGISSYTIKHIWLDPSKQMTKISCRFWIRKAHDSTIHMPPARINGGDRFHVPLDHFMLMQWGWSTKCFHGGCPNLTCHHHITPHPPAQNNKQLTTRAPQHKPLMVSLHQRIFHPNKAVIPQLIPRWHVTYMLPIPPIHYPITCLFPPFSCPLYPPVTTPLLWIKSY